MEASRRRDVQGRRLQRCRVSRVPGVESNSARTKHRYYLQTPAHRRHREQHRSACIRAHRTLTYYNLTTTQCLGTGKRHGPACSSQGGHYSRANPQITLQSALPLRAVAGPQNNHPKTATPSPSPGLCMHCMQPSNHASSLPCDPNQTPRKARTRPQAPRTHHAYMPPTIPRPDFGRQNDDDDEGHQAASSSPPLQL